MLTLNYNQTSCTIHFKNSDKSITFIDTNTKDELNKIKRVFLVLIMSTILSKINHFLVLIVHLLHQNIKKIKKVNQLKKE